MKQKLYLKWIGSLKAKMLPVVIVLLMAVTFTNQALAQTVLISPTGNGGFESGTTFAANGWTVANAASGNSWAVGTAAVSAGARGAYISNNSGTSNNYTNFGLFSSASRTVHFYRDVTFPAGQTSITLSFKWRCAGEAGADYIKVSLAATSVVPTSGTDIAAGNQIAGPYAGQGSAFQTVTLTIPASNAGTTKRLIFTWINNNNIVGTNPAGAFDEISLTSCAPPVVTASNNGPVCAGDNITLTATGGGTYAWTGPNGFTSTSATPTVSSMNSSKIGTYTVTVTSGGCSASATTALNFNPAPTGTPSFTPSNVCSGAQVNLNSNAVVDFGGLNTADFAIPDNNTTGVSSSIVAPGSGMNANQVTSVKININHTFDGDLDIFLVAPNGSQIELSTDNGAGGDNYTNTIFKTGFPSITGGSAPFTGTYAPEQAFSSLTGTAHGTWQLVVKDDAGVDTGTLLDWTLQIHATSGITYSWSSNTSGFTANTSTASDFPTATSLYSMLGTYAGCSSTLSVNVPVLDLPVINASSNEPVCENGDLFLISSGGSIYSWSGPGFVSSQQNPTLNGITTSNAGNYTVTVTDAFGCSNSQTLSVAVNEVPDITVTSQTNITCNGGTDGELIVTATGGSGFYLYSDGVNANFDGIFSGLSAGSHSITATDGFSCESSVSASLTEPDPTTIAAAGSDFSLCDGVSSVLNANTAIVGTGSWSVVTGSAIFTDPNNPLSGISNIGPGVNTVRWTIDNGICGSNFDDVDITRNELPVAQITGSTTICSGQSATLTVSFTGAGPWTYSYTNGLNSFGPFTTSNNPEIITVAPVVSRTYVVSSVSDINCNGTVSGSAEVTVNVGPPGSSIATSSIVAPTAACAGNVVNVSCNSVPNVNGYTWSVPAGTLINGEPGPVTTATPNATLTLGPLPGNSSGWLVCVFASNACAATNQKCFYIRGTLSMPSPVSGSDVACANTTASYSVLPVTGAETYSWTGTGGINVISGNGTTGVTVSFDPGFTQGTLCVSAGLNCGYNGVSRCFTIKNTTALLGQMSGPFALCPGQTNQVFSVPPVNGASAYNWTVPSHISIVSGQGTPTLTVNVGNNFNLGQLCVAVVSNCGVVSSTRCKTLSTTSPATPGNISGAANGVCGQTVTYSVASIPGVTGYNWTLPVGAFFASANGNNSVDVTFGNNFTTGQVCVTAENSCGTSTSRCLSVKGIPSNPNSISGPASVCANESGLMFSVAPVSGSNGYIWTVPAGANIIAGQNTTSIIVDWGTASGQVTVRAINDCGTSGTRTALVNVGCRMASNASAQFNVYPNPASDVATVSFEAGAETKVQIVLSDLSGRVVTEMNTTAQKGHNSVALDLSTTPKGVYLVKVYGIDNQSYARLTVQ